MRYVVAILVCLAGASAAAAPLDEARKLLLTGKYEEAADAYNSITKEHPVEAAIGQARAKHAVGEREAAEKSLREALAQQDVAALHAELALVLFERGALDEAEASAKQAIALNPNQVSARWLAAELLQSRGRLKEAEEAYEWLIDYHGKAEKIDDPEAILYIGRAAAQYARWRRNSGQFRVLVNELYPEALELDEQFWPAHLEIALLFVEKYNEGEATSALNAAVAINPNAAELHTIRAALALQKFDVKTAATALKRAIAINPNLLPARQLAADLLLADQRVEEAAAALEAARKLNPADEETLGRLAACYLMLDGDGGKDVNARSGKLIAEVVERNEHCGRFFATIGDTFDLLRKYPQASHYYDEAHRRMPQLIYVRGRNGLVKMRLGEEVEAAKLLAKSFEEDPFNVRVKNMLEVLDVLQGYAVIETEHFVIKFDRGRDELLAKYMARYLEDEVYPEIVETLGYEPEGKSLFEVFNRAKNTRGHSWFSARMVGLPFIGTVGACGGKIVAVASPSDMQQKFHWGRVLKHEFVHVVNLQQTDFNIPHWFTEGIAVRLEQMPRPTSWNEILARRMQAKKLFDLGDINLGFIRPGGGEDWTLAYCQAELYCDYLVATYGDDALAKLLKAYRENLTTEKALAREFDVKLADFEQGYLKFVEEELTRAGHAAAAQAKEEQKTLAEWEEAVEEKPEDAGLQAQLALAHLEAGSIAAARKAALAARKIEPTQALAGYVLAKIQTSIGDVEGAKELLLAAHDDEHPEERVVALLAAIQFQAEEYAAVEKHYRLGMKHFAPRDKWLKALAKLYLKTEDERQLTGVLEELAGVEYDNATLRKKLAQLALAHEDWTSAERWAKDALFIELADAELHAQLAEARHNLKKWPGAIEEYEAAVELDPDRPDWRMALADACVAAGQKEKAKAVLRDLIEIAPEHPGAKELQEQLAQ